MFWFSRRRYSDPIQKLWAKYFISTQIKETSINCFNSDYIDLLTLISKDEATKNDLYASTDNDKRDNRQYLVDILRLNDPMKDEYLDFMKATLDIFERNDSKEMKQISNIYHCFFRVIIRFVYLFTTQIEQKKSPISDSEESPQKFSIIISVAFRIFQQNESDIFLLLKEFFICLLSNSEFIMSNNELRIFSNILFQKLLKYIQTLPFSIDYHLFLFSAMNNYFRILKNQLEKTDLLDNEIESMKEFIIFITENYKIISQKYTTQITNFFESIYNVFLLFPVNNNERYYSLGLSSLQFFKNCIRINQSYILNDPNFFNSILFLVWSLDTFPIENFPEPTLQYTNNFINSIQPPNSYLTFEFQSSPPIFSLRKEGFLYPIDENIIPEKVANVFKLYIEIITGINNPDFQSKIFEFLSIKLIKSIEWDKLPIKVNHDFTTALFYISFLFSYIGLNLTLKKSDYDNFVVLFNKVFYIDNEQNYSVHTYFRSYIFRLFAKIFESDPILVIDGFQQVLNESQLHICDEIFLFLSFVMKKKPSLIINNLSLHVYPKFFFLLQKMNENRTLLFTFIYNVFLYDEGRTKFLSYENFVSSIFNFLFSDQTKDDVSKFILSSYEKENDLKCFNIVYKIASNILNHSELPEKKWIDFFNNFLNLLNPIFKKSIKLNIKSNEYSEFFESLKNTFSKLKNKEEKCLVSSFLNLITIFTSNNDMYRKRCLKFYTDSLPIFNNIVIENIDDEIIIAMLSHIFEINVDSISNPVLSQLIFKNPNGLTFLHNSIKNYDIHKNIFESLGSCFSSDLANQVLLSQSNFPFVLIDFLKYNMKHKSFSTFLQLFDNTFGNNFDVKHFLYLCKSPLNSDIETQNNWKRYSFQIIEALSARSEKELSLRYVFLNGEKTEISFIDSLQIPFEIRMNFSIRSFPKNHCNLISFFSKTKQASDLFGIDVDKKGKISILYHSYLVLQSNKPPLIYKIDTEIQIPKNKNIEFIVIFSNNLLNFHIKEYENSGINTEENEKTYEVKCQLPEFISGNQMRITLFNSAKKPKKHAICAFLFYFSLTLNNNKKTSCCLNLYTEYITSNHMNKISDFEINGVVKYHVTNIFTFLKKESGTYLLLELIDNSILFLHFIHIIANLMHNSDKFEDHFFKYIFHVALAKVQNLNITCWTRRIIETLSKFTLKLNDKKHSEQIIQSIWLNFEMIWLKFDDKDLQHFTFSEIIPKFYSDYKDFFKEKTNSKLYISALQKCILKDNNELIMNDLLNILFFYLKNGFSEIDIKPIKSFILNSNNINLKIQFNLRLFGILNFSVNENISLLDKFNNDDQYQFLLLFLNDLNLIDRNYITQFMTEDSFNVLSNLFIENKNMQNIFFDLIIIHSEFVSPELLLSFISKINSDFIISKILSSPKHHLRTFFLIFILFHSSSQKYYDINTDQTLIKFYSLLLSKDPTFIKNFIMILQLFASYFHFDAAPFLRSIFLSIFQLTLSSDKIDLIIIYAFTFIYFIPKNDYYYNNVSLYNLMDEQYHIQNENKSKLKQISLFDFVGIHQSINHESVLPLRFSIRIDRDGKLIDKNLMLELIGLIEKNKKFDYKFSFTTKQAIYGIQMVSLLYISLVKSEHSICWDSISFFLRNYPIFGHENSIYEKSAIQIVCYSLVPELEEFSNFGNSFRLFCNRFYACFEEASQTLSDDVYLTDEMKPSEMNVIINSFSEVYYYQLLLMKNFEIYLTFLCTGFLTDFDEFLKNLNKLQKIEKIDMFDYNEFIDLMISQFKYSNNLNCIKLLNNEGKTEKPFLFFNDTFHPVMFTSFSWKFIEYENKIDYNNSEESILIKHVNILTLKGKISSYFIQRKDTIIIGGYLSKLDSIKWVLQRSSTILEFFYKKGGLMLLVEFDSQLKEEFINQFPVLEETKVIQKWKEQKMTNYDLILRLNFINGRSFNDIDNYIIFPRLMKTVNSNSSVVKDCSFRNFQEKLKAIESNKIQEIHNHVDITKYLNEEQCELIPELFSMSEVSSIWFTKSHIDYLESSIVSSQIHLWIKTVFDVNLPSKEIAKNEKKNQFEITSISKIIFCPFDVFKGSFYSLSNDNQIVISKLKNGVLVHFKIPFDPSIQFKNAKLFTCPKEKLISIYIRNYTGFTIYSYESSTVKIKENVIMSSLIETIGRINEEKFYIITSSKRMIICENLYKISSFLEGIDILVAYSNYFLNLMIILCDDGNVIFVSIDSLMFQKHFSINQTDVKWCILDNKGNSIFANESEIFSYDVNGRILASTKSRRNLTLVSHVAIQNDDFLAIATELPNLYLVNTENLENVYTIRTVYPVVSFQFDYKTGIAIIYDNCSTYFISFLN